MLNLGESAPKGATAVQPSTAPVQSAPSHIERPFQDVVAGFMAAGALFGSAVVLARRALRLDPARLITTADLEDRP